MSDEHQAAAVPLIELASQVPHDLRAEWPIMWADDGREIGHSMAPVGKYVHELIAQVADLQSRLAECEQTAARIASERACLEIDFLNIRAEVARLHDVIEDQNEKLDVAEAGCEQKEAELAALREVVEKAPHHWSRYGRCDAYYSNDARNCTCWKRDALGR